LAAHRAGIHTLDLPKDNKKDLYDVPADIRADFTIHFVESMDEVLKVALTRSPVPLDEQIGAETGFRPYIEKDPDNRQGPVMH
jgi:predicted ATP-dependent protease